MGYCVTSSVTGGGMTANSVCFGGTSRPGATHIGPMMRTHTNSHETTVQVTHSHQGTHTQITHPNGPITLPNLADENGKQTPDSS
jgi:hypothetical protein